SDPAVDDTNVNATNPSGGLSDMARESLVAAELLQCLPPSVANSRVPQTTTLSAVSAPAATTISVASAANLAPGDQIPVSARSAGETNTIGVISGTTETVGGPLATAHASGAGTWDTCTSAPTGAPRQLDPSSAINVTSQVTPSALNWTAGSLHYADGS